MGSELDVDQYRAMIRQIIASGDAPDAFFEFVASAVLHAHEYGDIDQDVAEWIEQREREYIAKATPGDGP